LQFPAWHGVLLQLPLTHFFLRHIYLPSHIEILLRNPAGRVSAERARDLRVADIDVGVMVRRLGRFGYRRYKTNSGQEIPELKGLGDRVSSPAPAREIAELSLDRNVGSTFSHRLLAPRRVPREEDKFEIMARNDNRHREFRAPLRLADSCPRSGVLHR
jgi:hypothetical protein